MSEQLGSLLVRARKLRPLQLEEALRRQSERGGRLGTNLVELGYLDIDLLTAALAGQRRVVAATVAEFEAVTPAVLGVLPRDVAAQCLAYPLRAGQGALVVAMASPWDPTAVRALEAAVGRSIVAKVAPELRILEYLERRYAVPHPRKARAPLAAAAPAVASAPPPDGPFGRLGEGEFLSSEEDDPYLKAGGSFANAAPLAAPLPPAAPPLAPSPARRATQLPPPAPRMAPQPPMPPAQAVPPVAQRVVPVLAPGAGAPLPAAAPAPLNLPSGVSMDPFGDSLPGTPAPAADLFGSLPGTPAPAADPFGGALPGTPVSAADPFGGALPGTPVSAADPFGGALPGMPAPVAAPFSDPTAALPGLAPAAAADAPVPLPTLELAPEPATPLIELEPEPEPALLEGAIVAEEAEPPLLEAVPEPEPAAPTPLAIPAPAGGDPLAALAWDMPLEAPPLATPAPAAIAVPPPPPAPMAATPVAPPPAPPAALAPPPLADDAEEELVLSADDVLEVAPEPPPAPADDLLLDADAPVAAPPIPAEAASAPALPPPAPLPPEPIGSPELASAASPETTAEAPVPAPSELPGEAPPAEPAPLELALPAAEPVAEPALDIAEPVELPAPAAEPTVPAEAEAAPASELICRPVPSLFMVEDALARASRPEKIAESLLWACEGRFEAAAFLTVEGGVARGCEGFGAEGSVRFRNDLTVSLTGADSLLRTAVERQSHLIDALGPADAEICRRLGIGAGGRGAVVPFVYHGIVVTALWAALGRVSEREQLAEEIERIGAIGARAFARTPWGVGR